jgi:hypothetical protein
MSILVTACGVDLKIHCVNNHLDILGTQLRLVFGEVRIHRSQFIWSFVQPVIQSIVRACYPVNWDKHSLEDTTYSKQLYDHVYCSPRNTPVPGAPYTFTR